MSGFLLDTNCISELVRIRPDPCVTAWVRAQPESHLHLSVLTFGEIRKGATLLPAGARRTQFEQWLEKELPVRFAGRILPISAEIAEIWGTMAAEARLRGIGLPTVDGLISATARHHGLVVATSKREGLQRLWDPGD